MYLTGTTFEEQSESLEEDNSWDGYLGPLGPIQICPPWLWDDDDKDTTVRYSVRVRIVTRAGEIPIRGAKVSITNEHEAVEEGVSNIDGTASFSRLRLDKKLRLKVSYKNDSEFLSEEVFTWNAMGIDPKLEFYADGMAKHVIEKIPGKNVVGGENEDSTFEDMYPAELDQVVWLDHSDEKNKILHINVKMATLSLDVHYLRQTVGDESITSEPLHEKLTPKYSNTLGPFNKHALCMPTSSHMLLTYHDNSKSRKTVMQDCFLRYSEDYLAGAPLKPPVIEDNVNKKYDVCEPRPWQSWLYLKAVFNEKYLKDTKKTAIQLYGNEQENVPGDFVTHAFVEKHLQFGEPMITSCNVTNGGHVVLIRGAIVNHRYPGPNSSVPWLILNDAYIEKHVYYNSTTNTEGSTFQIHSVKIFKVDDKEIPVAANIVIKNDNQWTVEQIAPKLVPGDG